MSEEQESRPGTLPPPLVSVVIIGRNEGDRLRRCLASVAAIERASFNLEVIYVDSGSIDDSVNLARSAGVETISLLPERPSAALGRNAGWRAAKGAFILFLDGDTVLHPHFVAHSLTALQSSQIAVVWGHRRELFPQHSLYNRILDLDWIYPPGFTAFCGGDALFRRSVLEQAGGFDETLIAGEEPELCRRIRGLGFTILHVDHPMTGHDLDITEWRQYWRRALRAGHAYAEVSERFCTTENPFWEDVSQANQRRALVLLGVTIVGMCGAALLRDPWPLVAVVFFFLTLSARSAWKTRWKSKDVPTLLLYGAHSHLQQIPIYLGQLQFRWNHRKGTRSMLIEYKKP